MRQLLPIIAMMIFPVLGRVALASPSPPLVAEFDRAIEEFDQALATKATQSERAKPLLDSAAQRFESLVAAGVHNGYLEFNLGNTYLHLGDIGRAVLHYRRAQRLIPRDPLLAENLGVARSKTLLSLPPARKSAVYRSLFFWHYQTSPSARFTAAIVTYTLFWLLLAARSVFRRSTGLLVAAVICALASSAAGGSLGVQRWQDRNAPDAVVVAGDVAVYKGPAETYQKQFEQSLQPGVELVVREERGEWVRIELSDGEGGWVPRDSVELVAGQRGGEKEVSLLRS